MHRYLKSMTLQRAALKAERHQPCNAQPQTTNTERNKCKQRHQVDLK
jgi:hypothetical protein